MIILVVISSYLLYCTITSTTKLVENALKVCSGLVGCQMTTYIKRHMLISGFVDAVNLMSFYYFSCLHLQNVLWNFRPIIACHGVSTSSMAQ